MARERLLRTLCGVLIRHRLPIVCAIAAVTAFFGWRASLLTMDTRLGDLLPRRHPFIATHEKYAADFGGANTVTVLIDGRGKTIFTAERLAQLYFITRAIERLPGVNPHHIESIAHRTVRQLRVGRRGTLRSEPFMLGVPATDAEVAAIRRSVHKSDAVYGKLVSLDGDAALERADFLESRLDSQRVFDALNDEVVKQHLMQGEQFFAPTTEWDKDRSNDRLWS